jgi:hypothetical protein
MLRQSSINYIIKRIKQLRIDDPKYLDECQAECKELFGSFVSAAFCWNDESFCFWLHKCGDWRVARVRLMQEKI